MPSISKTFVGFGFGPIQAGLFVYEAFRSGSFERLVVVEVLPELVAAVREAGGWYRVNVATPNGIEVREVRGVEVLNPRVAEDRGKLAQALAEASEIATALPSVDFYQQGEPSVASLLSAAVREKAANSTLPRCIVYTAENHNHAAEILQAATERGHSCPQQTGNCNPVLARHGADRNVRAPLQFLNTVIGKMSGVVADPAQIAAGGLSRLTEHFPRAFLVEEFNRILISKIESTGFERGIEVFIEKPDLLPFEEAKLYGHNAVHALMGYLARREGCSFMSEVARHPSLVAFAREAFLEECGPALIARHSGLDPLFTREGFEEYADDLLGRMINPYLCDGIERVTRDTPRKLGWEDRLIGTMRMVLDTGSVPRRFALGAAAALETLGSNKADAAQFEELWPEADQPPGRKSELIRLIIEAQSMLKKQTNEPWKLLMS